MALDSNINITDVMCIFRTERKRMSVIMKDEAGDIWLYCKGADSAVFPLIVKGKMRETAIHVADFSMVCCLASAIAK